MRAIRWVAVIGALLVVAAFGRRPRTVPAKPAQHPVVEHPECPHAWYDSSAVPSTSTWPTVNVPEYNDCQRFIVNQGKMRGYTPGYFAILAYPYAGTLASQMTPINGTPLTMAAAVAFIYADSFGYKPLHISSGGNCLYVYLDSLKWVGLIRTATARPGRSIGCDRVVDPRRGGEDLPVRRDTVQGMSFPDYPDAARWDWDPKARLQYAGVRCDGAWCDIGGTFSLHGHPEFSRALTRRERRTAEIKGWFDEEYLARCDERACHPTALMATVIPDSSLDDATAATYSPLPPGHPEFVQVARVALRVDRSVPEAHDSTADLALYWSKLHLTRTPSAKKLNQLWLCNASAADCGVPPKWTTNCPPVAPPAPDEVDPGMWWYKIVPADGREPRYGCYAKRDYAPPPGAPSDHVVGAARWRWLINDQTNWVRCVQGCCEVQGGP